MCKRPDCTCGMKSPEKGIRALFPAIELALSGLASKQASTIERQPRKQSTTPPTAPRSNTAIKQLYHEVRAKKVDVITRKVFSAQAKRGEAAAAKEATAEQEVAKKPPSDKVESEDESPRCSSRLSKKRQSPTLEKPGTTKSKHPKHHVHHDYHDHARDPQQMPDQKASKNHRHINGGVAAPFPLVLHSMLETVEIEGMSDIVSWQPHGRAFAVHNVKAFVSQVMPRFFRQTKLSSFQRQLNLYEFSRMTGVGPDKGAYFHELFLRGRFDLCSQMHRNRVKGTGVRSASSPSSEPNFYAMSFLGGKQREQNYCAMTFVGRDDGKQQPSRKPEKVQSSPSPSTPEATIPPPEKEVSFSPIPTPEPMSPIDDPPMDVSFSSVFPKETSWESEFDDEMAWKLQSRPPGGNVEEEEESSFEVKEEAPPNDDDLSLDLDGEIGSFFAVADDNYSGDSSVVDYLSDERLSHLLESIIE